MLAKTLLGIDCKWKKPEIRLCVYSHSPPNVKNSHVFFLNVIVLIPHIWVKFHNTIFYLGNLRKTLTSNMTSPPPRFFLLTSSVDNRESSRPGVFSGARLVEGLHCVASVHASLRTALIFRPLARSRAVNPLSSVKVTSAPCFNREQAARSWSLYACKQ